MGSATVNNNPSKTKCDFCGGDEVYKLYPYDQLPDVAACKVCVRFIDSRHWGELYRYARNRLPINNRKAREVTACILIRPFHRSFRKFAEA